MAAVDMAVLGLGLDASGMVTGGRQAEGALDRVSNKVSATESHVRRMAARLGAAFGSGVILAKFIRETSEAQDAQAQLESAIRSTGGAAGLSVSQLSAYADELQRTTKFSDDAVKAAQALLLTFTSIRGDVFRDATVAIADLATRMGGDLKGAALQVGKALQDPAQGLLALRRSGVSFSEAQQEVIKNLFQTGRQAEAQRMILAELSKEFGGAAVAARDTLGGALAGLGNAWGDLFEVTRSSSGGMIAAINGIASILPKVRDGFNAFFGGFALLAVDASIAWQRFLISVQEVSASALEAIALVLSRIPGFTDNAASLLVAADKLRLGTEGLGVALVHLRQAEYDKIVGVGASTAAVITATSANDGYRKSAEELAKAEREYRSSVSETVSAIVAASEFERLRPRALEEAARMEAALRAELTSKNNSLERTVFLTQQLAEIESVVAAQRARMSRSPVESTVAREITGGPRTVQMINDPTAYIAVRKQWEDAARATQQVWEETARGIQQALARGFESVLTDGLKGFAEFGRSLVDLFRGVAAQIAAALAANKLGLPKLIKEIEAGTSDTFKRGHAGFKGLESLSSGKQIGGAALIGGAIGYQSKSAGMGLLSGFAAGAATGNPIAALAGGLSGLIGGLLGAAKAAREAAAAQRAYQLSLESFRQGIEGTAEGKAIADAQAEAIKLKKAAKDSGFKGYELMKVFDEIDRLTAIRIEQIKAETAARAAQVAAEAAAAAAAKAAYNQVMQQDATIRIMRGQGLDLEADAAARLLANARELEQAAKDGADAWSILSIKLAQAAEQARLVADALKGFDQINRDALNAMEDVATQTLIHSIEVASQRQIAAIDRQIEVAQAALETNREQLRAQEQAINETRRVVETLGNARRNMLTGPLSNLSPIGQLNEARSQAERLAGMARGGDRAAATALPEVLQRLLESSRGYNASGPGYGRDFDWAQNLLTELEGKFGAQLTVEERILEELKGQTVILQAQIASLQASRERAAADAQRQIDGLLQILAITQAARESSAATNSLIAAMERVRETLTGVGQAIVTGQIQSLGATRDSMNAATQAQVQAINSGADANTIKQLDQIRILELSKNDYNTKAVEQIRNLAAIAGWGSAEVAAAERLRQETIDKFNEQINATREAPGIIKLALDADRKKTEMDRLTGEKNQISAINDFRDLSMGRLDTQTSVLREILAALRNAPTPAFEQALVQPPSRTQDWIVRPPGNSGGGNPPWTPQSESAVVQRLDTLTAAVGALLSVSQEGFLQTIGAVQNVSTVVEDGARSTVRRIGNLDLGDFE